MIFMKFIFTVCFGPYTFIVGQIPISFLLLLNHKYNSVDCVAIGQTLQKLQCFVYKYAWQQISWPMQI